MQKIDYSRRIVLLGYYNLIDKAPACGATIHKTKQFLTVLKMRIGMGADISSEYENEIKKVIRRLYISIDKGENTHNLLK